ncbi:conserved hypothetical protein [Luminiphilus syltensis NOR5-1B]|uniref:DUF2237 domain-containing protein n=1 Tax=Luminiphilus syltensis NOR5-1B TaxID=565045 RepID=B8KXB1_9GAMM|nr:DUF2237 domain-containing protein [Luminiphilus syltensis]EED34292.1 conserved hypothetical protein [Luminiphilus syltensis NOR5-1B]
MSTQNQLNVLGEPLECCCQDPLTGFYRDGFCNTGPGDAGLHTVCAQVDDDFLGFSAQAGNDLSTPRPEFEFPGLQSGDAWCLCAARWAEAHQMGLAPKVFLRRTNIKTLELIPLEWLKAYAIDIS